MSVHDDELALDSQYRCAFGTPEFPWHHESEEWPGTCDACGAVLDEDEASS